VTAGEQQGGRVGVIAALKLRVIDDARLIARTLQCSPKHGVFHVGPIPAHVRVGAPEKLNISGRADGAAKEPAGLDVFHSAEGLLNIPEDWVFNQAGLADDAETSLPDEIIAGKDIAIVPSEDMKANGAGTEGFPHLAR